MSSHTNIHRMRVLAGEPGLVCVLAYVLCCTSIYFVKKLQICADKTNNLIDLFYFHLF